MEKYIDTERIKRHKIITHYPGDYHNGWNDAIDEILEDEPADVQKVKHGRWIDKGRFALMCGCCEEYVARNLLYGYRLDYCPKCGAKMDGKESE